ncbi:MAG: sulfotransferase family 2 domain-containing protein [Paracoccaceae bacterium]|nr:sulfotransferase family 2 domain-containing protein [Paracoccaceae bacterium]
MSGFATLVCVRNPYHRAISGFLDKIAGGTDPMYHEYPCYGDDSISAFEAFLQHLADHDFFGNRHFMPQTSLLIQPVDRFTRVARLETVVADMDAFLTGLGHPPSVAAPLSKPHPLEMRDKNKIHGSTKKEHYLTPVAAHLIGHLYRSDFQAFGYDLRI